MNRLNRESGNVLPVRIYGDQLLRKKSEPVEEIDGRIKGIISDLIATMYEKDGIGLAAPQIGHNLRIFVVDPDWFRSGEKNPRVFINPRFLSLSGVEEEEEGCLSLPGITAEVKRAEKVVIEAMDQEGKMQRYEAEGLYARALQHENDHLDGILFIDRISKLKLITLKWKLRALEQKKDNKGVNLDTYFSDKQSDIPRNS
jgi:peptide deformylase